MNGSRLRYFRFMFTRAAATSAVNKLSTQGSLFDSSFERREGLATGLYSKHFPGVAWADLPEAWRKSGERVVAMVLEVAESKGPLIKGSTTYSALASTMGHIGVLRNDVEHSDEAKSRISDIRFALRGPFSAFPRGILLLPESLGADYVNADDKRQYLALHEAEIKKFHADTLEKEAPPGWSYKGNYIILGNGSVVRCAQHDVMTGNDGSVVQLLHMQTTSWHVFDGSFVWGYYFHPDAPRIITSVGLQSGKHAWYCLDFANAAGGIALFHHNNFAAPYVLETRKLGHFITGDLSVVRDWHLWVMGMCLASLDSASPLLQEFRSECGPPHTVAEIDDRAAARIMAGGPESVAGMDLPEASACGLFVDGVEMLGQDYALGMPSGPQGYDDVRRTMDTMLRYQMSQSTWERIQSDVSAFAANQLGSEWTTRSRSELLEGLLSQVESRLPIENIINDAILAPVQPQVDATIASLKLSPGDRGYMSRCVIDGFRRDYVALLLTNDGALRVSLDLEILDRQVKAIDLAATEKLLAQASERAASARAEMDRLRKAAEGAQGDELKKLLDEIAQHEKTEAEAAQEAARYEEQLADVNDYAARHEEQSDKVRDQSQRMFGDHDRFPSADAVGLTNVAHG